MKTLKLYLSIVLLLALVSCEKKDEVAPEEVKMDLTKYFITWEAPRTTYTGNRIFNWPVLVLFENDGKIKMYNFASNTTPTQGSYTLTDDQLTITTSNQILGFTIKEGSIVDTKGFTYDIQNTKLRELPSTNQFTGNYSGMLNSYMVNTAFPFSFSFNYTQFGEGYNGQPQLDYVLNPINNVFAISSINSVLRYFLMVDGKLTIVRLKSGGTNAESLLYATLSKDQ
jgi:major membrane immunogen (membrane-anchored lipoprotein)